MLVPTDLLVIAAALCVYGGLSWDEWLAFVGGKLANPAFRALAYKLAGPQPPAG